MLCEVDPDAGWADEVGVFFFDGEVVGGEGGSFFCDRFTDFLDRGFLAIDQAEVPANLQFFGGDKASLFADEEGMRGGAGQFFDRVPSAITNR